MKALLLILALAFAAPAPRTTCHHGCGSKYCKKVHCGKKCHANPCRGCWKY